MVVALLPMTPPETQEGPSRMAKGVADGADDL